MPNDVATKTVVVFEEARMELHAIRIDLNGAIDEAETRIDRLAQLYSRARRNGSESELPEAA